MKARSGALVILLSVSAGALPTLDATRASPRAAAPAAAEPPAPRSLEDLDRMLTRLDASEKATKKELKELETEAATAEARTIARGRAYTRLARAGLLPISGGFDELVDHAARLERLRRALRRDLAREKQITKRRAQLGERLADLRDRRAPLEAQHESLAGARAAVLAAEDRKRAFERAFSGSIGPSGDHTAVYGSGVGPATPGAKSGSFLASKGQLAFPIAGRAEIRTASRYGGGPGLEMIAPAGTAVRAVFAGRVAFADSYADYGRTVILDHGASYYTVSANLGSIQVAVGDDVSAGARIGGLGGGSAPALYFEVRQGTTTLDPGDWFGL